MGRLIDADALMERVDESRRDNPYRDGKISVNHINEHSHFLDMIIEAPTIDVEPVKYGEFTTLDEVNTFVTAFPKRCETCGTEFILLFRKSEPNQGMFCPRCGARRRDDHETD